MPAMTEDAELIRYTLAYVDELYRELTQENGAPALGTQNQVVDFVLADPELRAAVARRGRIVEEADAAGGPPLRLPRDAAYERVRACLTAAMGRPARGGEPAPG